MQTKHSFLICKKWNWSSD